MYAEALRDELEFLSENHKHPSCIFRTVYTVKDIKSDEEGYYVWIEDEDGMATKYHFEAGLQEYIGVIAK